MMNYMRGLRDSGGVVKDAVLFMYDNVVESLIMTMLRWNTIANITTYTP